MALEPLAIGYTGAGLLFVFLAMGIPVGVAMGVIGIGGMLLGAGPLLRSVPGMQSITPSTLAHVCFLNARAHRGRGGALQCAQ